MGDRGSSLGRPSQDDGSSSHPSELDSSPLSLQVCVSEWERLEFIILLSNILDFLIFFGTSFWEWDQHLDMVFEDISS